VRGDGARHPRRTRPFAAPLTVRRTWGRWLLGLAAVALLAGYLAWKRSLGPEVTVVEAVRGDLVQTVAATGRVITPSRLDIGTVIVGTVQAVLAREGSTVPAGAVLARLRDDEQRAAVAQARATLAEAEARLAQLDQLAAPVADQSMRQAEANFAWSRDELARTRQLAERGFFSRSKVEEAERNFAVAAAARESAQTQALTNRPQGSDHALALARRTQAQAALEVAIARLDLTQIRTPIAGTVLRRIVEPGDVVTAGKVMFEIASSGPTRLVLQVDEKNLSLVRLDQPALAVTDAFAGERFAARVSYVAPGVDVQRGSVEVKLAVPEPPAFLRPDMTVSVEIDTGRANGVVIVPSDVIRDAATGAPWIMVVRDGRTARQPVRTGMRGTGRTEIREGVAPGEWMLPGTLAIAEGARVRASVQAAPARPALKAQEIFR